MPAPERLNDSAAENEKSVFDMECERVLNMTSCIESSLDRLCKKLHPVLLTNSTDPEEIKGSSKQNLAERESIYQEFNSELINKLSEFNTILSDLNVHLTL